MNKYIRIGILVVFVFVVLYMVEYYILRPTTKSSYCKIWGVQQGSSGQPETVCKEYQ